MVFVSKRGKSSLILKLSVIVLNQSQIQNYDRQCGYLAVSEKINELINDFIAQLLYCIQSELKKAA